MSHCAPCKEKGILRVAHYKSERGNPATCYDCRNGDKVTKQVEERIEETAKPKGQGVNVEDAGDLIKILSNVMAGVIEGSMAPSQANAICTVADKMVKVIELRHRLEEK